MLNNMYYNERNEPVLVYAGRAERAGARRGHLSRQDSRNFRSSASPPPSRSRYHESSWFGHRRSSQSPPRSGLHSYQSQYSDYRDAKYGRSPERRGWFGRKKRDSWSPPRSSRLTTTMFKEEYTGLPADTGYGYHHGSHSHGHGSHGYPYSGVSPYTTLSLYQGTYDPAVPRTYQAPYVPQSEYAESIKLKVPLCCEACEDRITNHMLSLEGVESVTCDPRKKKVTVRGIATPSEILRTARECFRDARFWRE